MPAVHRKQDMFQWLIHACSDESLYVKRYACGELHWCQHTELHVLHWSLSIRSLINRFSYARIMITPSCTAHNPRVYEFPFIEPFLVWLHSTRSIERSILQLSGVRDSTASNCKNKRVASRLDGDVVPQLQSCFSLRYHEIGLLTSR